MADLRTYGATAGQASTFQFPFVDPSSTDGDYLGSAPPLAAGDARIMKDGGAWANTTNLPVWKSEGYGSITLTASEMTAQIVVVKIRDQTSPRVWVTTSFIVHTGGNASALHSGT